MVLLITEGDQVPTIPFGEVELNIGGVEPEQIAIDEKIGIIFGFTVMVIDATVAHCPGFGVNV